MNASVALEVDIRSAYETSALLGVSPTAGAMLVSWQDVTNHFQEPVSRTSVEQRFAELATTWRQSTAASSSLAEMFLDPSYQRIIALGTAVVPSILRELRDRPHHWYWALEMITGANPVEPADEGDLRKMCDAWLEWGRGAGYVG